MVLIVSLILVSMFVLWGALSPLGLASVMQFALSATISRFGWFYLLSMFGFLVFALYLAFSRYGKIRLGGEDAEPDFTRHSWFSMLFAAGMGIGLVFWGVAEPLSHYATPPSGIPESADSARIGLRYTFFHWGLHPWAAYCVVGLALAFFKFNRDRPMLMSTTFEPLIGKHAQGPIGKIVDILAVVATAFGVATSLGLGAMQISSGLHKVFGLTNGVSLQLTVVAIAAVLYLASSLSGLDRGVKILSNINMVLAMLLLLFVLSLGPTLFIMDMLTTTLGDYLNNLVAMSMRMTPFSKGTWIADWTLFYWAWWVTWAPFVGMFIARISRGRTIREFVTGVLLVPSLISFLWFATFGGAAIHAVMFDHLPLVEVVKQDTSLVLFSMLDSLPWGTLTSLLAIVLVSVFFVTSADSATFVLGMMTSKGNPTPSARIKLAWGVLTALVAAILLLSGGLKGVQATSIVIALPFMVIMLVMCIGLVKALDVEANKLERRRHARDKLLERLLSERENSSS